MADLLLANVDSAVADEEVKAFLEKYGFPPFDEIEHVPGGGAHPAVRLTFKDAPAEALRTLLPRIQDMFWKNHKIHAQVVADRYL